MMNEKVMIGTKKERLAEDGSPHPVPTAND